MATAVTPQVNTFFDSLPALFDFIVAAGFLAGALIAIYTAWRTFRPNYKKEVSADLDKVKADFIREISALKAELKQELHDIVSDLDSLDDRTVEVEKSIVQIEQIHKRFDRVENKIDDMTQILLQKVTSHPFN